MAVVLLQPLYQVWERKHLNRCPLLAVLPDLSDGAKDTHMVLPRESGAAFDSHWALHSTVAAVDIMY